MEKLENIEFHTGGDVPLNSPGVGFQFLMARSARHAAVRTRSKKAWPREGYRNRDKTKDNIHFISYDSGNEVYLLETAVRIGKGYQRQESSLTVAELKVRLGSDAAGSMEQIVESLAEDLAYSDEGFAARPVLELERSNRRLAPDDPLSKGRGAEGLSEENRAMIRALLTRDPVEKDDLPKGVLTTLTLD
jgi:hypothetical protein